MIPGERRRASAGRRGMDCYSLTTKRRDIMIYRMGHRIRDTIKGGI